MSRATIILMSLLITVSVHAKVQVAFLELIHPDSGEVVPLEPGGNFGHVAISYAGGWLHSYPHRPVEFVESLDKFGRVAKIVTIEDRQPLTPKEVFEHIGKPFDQSYGWHSEFSTYCSKLVGQLLGIPPRPMQFSAEIWNLHSVETSDGWGLSPDDIDEHLQYSRGRTIVSSCQLAIH